MSARPEPPPAPSTAPHTATIHSYDKHPMYRIIETVPESEYEKTLEAALRTSMVPDGMQQICARWYPEFGREVADAFLEWRAKNQAVLDELRQRSTEVWVRRAGPDQAYVKMVYPHIRKEVADELLRQSDGVSVENFKATCARYAADVRKPDWKLDRRLRKYLLVIRERPLTAQQ